jgi:HAD superfamily hydrolase (TIGR01509 family)
VSDRDLPAAVLWDMDGTLVDTEPYWIACEHRLVREFGGTWTEQDAHSLVGNDLLVSAGVLRRRGGVDLPEPRIVERLLEGVIEQVRRRIPWRPGARELLAGLRERAVPCALVTMSYRRLAQSVVAELPADSFAVVVAGDDVLRGKPHPEPYLRAARLLGVPAGGCVALEDSPTGVASAEAAGAQVIAVEHLVPVPRAPGRVVITSLAGVEPGRLLALARSGGGPVTAEPTLAQ